MKRKAGFIAILLLLTLRCSAFADIKLYFFDVGNANATLVEADGQYMLVDAGINSTEAKLGDMLREVGVDKLAYAVGTHPHEDHIGGLDYILHEYPTDLVLLPDIHHDTKTYGNLLGELDEQALDVYYPKVGDQFPLGDATITVLSPKRSDYADINFFSLVLRIDYGETSVLLTGDAEDVNEFEMIDTGLDVDVDILQVAHHGSNTSSTDAFLDASTPDIAIISCGADNQYGHPHYEVMDRLINHGCTVLRTDQMGTIILSSNGTSWEIQTEID